MRWSNTIGGRDSNILRVAPDFTVSILNKKHPVIRGYGQHIRDFMFIEDTVNAAITVAEKQKITNGEAFNFGTGKPTKVLDLAELMIKLTGNENILKPIILNNPSVGEIDRQYLSFSKAKEKLGWEPKFNLEESVRNTIQWYSDNKWWFEVIERVSNFYKTKSK
jgi:nucleoside-diphosphate-sugar epimerase